MNRTLATGLWLLATLAISAGDANGQIATPVISDFESGDDGWSAVDPSEGSFGQVPSGGNPGGFYEFTDGASGSGIVSAPAKFLGDWSSLNGNGSLTYDHKIINLGAEAAAIAGVDVVLRGDSGASRARFTAPYAVTLVPPTDPTPTAWNTISIPIIENRWSLEQGSWTRLLADVESLEIRIEHVDNGGGTTGSGFEVDGMDNVSLDSTRPVPTMTTYGLLSCSLLLLAMGARQRTRHRG